MITMKMKSGTRASQFLERGTRTVNKAKAILILAAIACVWVVAALPANASTVGDIQAFYNSSSNFGQGVLDGVVFVIQNTSGAPITNGVFSLVGTDSFNVGTIAAGGQSILIPGASNDGGSSHTFFSFTGAIVDESDLGPNGDNTEFSFTGQQGGTMVESFDLSGTLAPGIFTPNFTKGLSNDATISVINFLGGGPQSDGPCNNCFGPKIVADINTPTVPEPSSLMLFGTGLLGLGPLVRRRAIFPPC
jgi:hypothetical protein